MPSSIPSASAQDTRASSLIRESIAASRQQEARHAENTLPLPGPMYGRLNRDCKAKAFPIMMGASLAGVGIAILLFCLGIGKRNKDGSSDTPNSLTNSSFSLFAFSLVLTAVSLSCSAEPQNIV